MFRLKYVTCFPSSPFPRGLSYLVYFIRILTRSNEGFFHRSLPPGFGVRPSERITFLSQRLSLSGSFILNVTSYGLFSFDIPRLSRNVSLSGLFILLKGSSEVHSWLVMYVHSFDGF